MSLYTKIFVHKCRTKVVHKCRTKLYTNVVLALYTNVSVHNCRISPGNISVLDILSEAGMINYFGKSNQDDKIEVEPLVLQKGGNKLALFGLGAVRNERLPDLFSELCSVLGNPRRRFQPVYYPPEQSKARREELHKTEVYSPIHGPCILGTRARKQDCHHQCTSC